MIETVIIKFNKIPTPITLLARGFLPIASTPFTATFLKVINPKINEMITTVAATMYLNDSEGL